MATHRAVGGEAEEKETEMARKTHLVGSWPGFSGAQAMDQAFARLGGDLLRLSDGETGERSWWIGPTLDWLRANPDLDLVKDGGYADYEDGPRYVVGEGRSFDPDNIQLNYRLAFERSYPAFKTLRARHGQPQVSFQVGLQSPVDLALNAFGPELAMSNSNLAAAFSAATLREVEVIRGQAGDDVIFQCETVVGMVMVAQAPPSERSAVAEQQASALAALAAGAPEGTRFGCHLCLGDMHHTALVEMGSAEPLVVFANMLAQAWPATQHLEYIHAPFAAASKPGSFEEQWYEPLRELDLPEAVRFVAGFIHEDLDLDQLRSILDVIDRCAGREVDIAATCGLGRRPHPDQAWDAMSKATRLIHDVAASQAGA
jgi:hypothetical protein